MIKLWHFAATLKIIYAWCVCVVAISNNHKQMLTKIKLVHFHKQRTTYIWSSESTVRLKIGMGKLNGYIKSTGRSTDCLHWVPLNWKYLFRINPWNRAHIRPKTRLKFLHMHLRFTRNNGIKYTCTDTRGCKQFYSSMCSTVLTALQSMCLCCPFVCC